MTTSTDDTARYQAFRETSEHTDIDTLLASIKASVASINDIKGEDHRAHDAWKRVQRLAEDLACDVRKAERWAKFK